MIHVQFEKNFLRFFSQLHSVCFTYLCEERYAVRLERYSPIEERQAENRRNKSSCTINWRSLVS